VILSGDTVRFHEDYKHDVVPRFNHDPAQTLASIRRIKQVQKNLRATVIIQHDRHHIGKRPAFSGAAK